MHLYSIFTILLFVFWVFQFVDLLNRSNDELPSKMIWVFLMILPPIGIPVSIFYFFTVKKRLDEEKRLKTQSQKIQIESPTDKNLVSPEKDFRERTLSIFKPSPNRFAIILENYDYNRKDELLEAIMIIRECSRERAEKILTETTLLVTNLQEDEAYGIKKELEIIGADVKLLTMEELVKKTK